MPHDFLFRGSEVLSGGQKKKKTNKTALAGPCPTNNSDEIKEPPFKPFLAGRGNSPRKRKVGWVSAGHYPNRRKFRT